MSTQTITSDTADAGVSLSNDQLPQHLIDAMQRIFKKHPGYRTTHAKGLLVEGVFTPTEQAKTLSKAAHFSNSSTPVTARFSVGGGIPKVADFSPLATPKGIAIRFQVDDDTHTDLVAHSFDGFAVRTGEEFLLFLQLLGNVGAARTALAEAEQKGGDTTEEQEAFDNAQKAFFPFLEAHPLAAKFSNGYGPNPHNYGTLQYYEPNTHILTNAEGGVVNVRYVLEPADGEHLYGKDELDGLSPSYLEEDLKQRFPEKPIGLNIKAHIADPGDVLDDATVPYKSTTFVPVGRLEINKVSDDNVERQQQIAFSPTPEKGGIQGIMSSQDPLIQVRKGVYWISTDQRRNEKQVETTDAE
ncbi:Catalase-related peroxidase [Colletotrichum spinosum]|uniref:Catalase-related peroxidase n=1 Tax=Colletotrichum spinosum TaxID=1347390 RepID=A0A4R8Q5Z7_9PEZI|nr:Catalase-related peroxidase [Colletotrichum spinosum]